VETKANLNDGTVVTEFEKRRLPEERGNWSAVWEYRHIISVMLNVRYVHVLGTSRAKTTFSQRRQNSLSMNGFYFYVLVIKGYCHRFNYVKESILVLCFLGTKLSHGCQVAQKGKRVNSTSGSLPACIDMLKPSEKLCNMRRNRFSFSKHNVRGARKTFKTHHPTSW
jgi:hypothetical protein